MPHTCAPIQKKETVHECITCKYGIRRNPSE
jgi:hypothetical protein